MYKTGTISILLVGLHKVIALLKIFMKIHFMTILRNAMNFSFYF